MPTTRKAPWAGPPPAPGSGGHGLTGGGGQQGPGPSSGGSAWPSPCPSRVHTVDAFSRCSVTAGLLTCPSQRSRRCGSPGCLLLPQSVAPMPQFLPSWRTEPCRGCPRGAVCGVPGHRLFCSQILAMTGRTVCLGHCRGPCPLSRLWAGLPLTLTLLSLIPAAPRPPPRQTVTDARRRRDAPLGRRHSGPGGLRLRCLVCPGGQGGAGSAIRERARACSEKTSFAETGGGPVCRPRADSWSLGFSAAEGVRGEAGCTGRTRLGSATVRLGASGHGSPLRWLRPLSGFAGRLRGFPQRLLHIYCRFLFTFFFLCHE